MFFHNRLFKNGANPCANENICKPFQSGETIPLIYSKINVNSTIMTMIFYSSGMKRPKKFSNFSKWGCMVRPEKWGQIVTKRPGTKRPRDA
jgi:hypothetical protein